MDWLGIIHLASAVASLVAGAAVLVAKKGTTWHRRAGWAYALAMATVNVTALSIYDLFGGFGPFHIAALLSGVTVLAGMAAALRRRPRKTWIAHHAMWMTWSYIGLCAAAASEISTRYLMIPFGAAVALATFAVVFVGWLGVRLRMPSILAAYGLGPKASGDIAP